MSALIILLFASLVVALGFLVAFIWSVKSGQFDDDYTPSVRILFEDALSVSQKENLSKPSSSKTNDQKRPKF